MAKKKWAGTAHGHGESALHHVHHILQPCKAQPHKGGVLHTVVVLVKVRTVPDEEVKEKQLAEFLRHCRLPEGLVERLRQAVFQGGVDEEPHRRQQRYVQKGRQHTAQQSLEQHRQRLLLVTVVMVNVPDQKQHRRQRRNQNDVHTSILHFQFSILNSHFIHWSNSSSLTSPSARAASRRVSPSAWACWAILAAL